MSNASLDLEPTPFRVLARYCAATVIESQIHYNSRNESDNGLHTFADICALRARVAVDSYDDKPSGVDAECGFQCEAIISAAGSADISTPTSSQSITAGKTPEQRQASASPGDSASAPTSSPRRFLQDHNPCTPTTTTAPGASTSVPPTIQYRIIKENYAPAAGAAPAELAEALQKHNTVSESESRRRVSTGKIPIAKRVRKSRVGKVYAKSDRALRDRTSLKPKTRVLGL